MQGCTALGSPVHRTNEKFQLFLILGPANFELCLLFDSKAYALLCVQGSNWNQFPCLNRNCAICPAVNKVSGAGCSTQKWRSTPRVWAMFPTIMYQTTPCQSQLIHSSRKQHQSEAQRSDVFTGFFFEDVEKILCTIFHASVCCSLIKQKNFKPHGNENIQTPCAHVSLFVQSFLACWWVSLEWKNPRNGTGAEGKIQHIFFCKIYNESSVLFLYQRQKSQQSYHMKSNNS